jgi:hypothetical protein
MKKILHTCAMECYSAIKKNKILSFVGKWMKCGPRERIQDSDWDTAADHMSSMNQGPC